MSPIRLNEFNLIQALKQGKINWFEFFELWRKVA